MNKINKDQERSQVMKDLEHVLDELKKTGPGARPSILTRDELKILKERLESAALKVNTLGSW